MTKTIKFDTLYGFATVNPVHECRIYGLTPDTQPFYEQAFEWMDFIFENGMDIIDCFELLYDIFEGFA